MIPSRREDDQLHDHMHSGMWYVMVYRQEHVGQKSGTLERLMVVWPTCQTRTAFSVCLCSECDN